MTYPYSGSLINQNVSSGLSTQIVVKVGNTTVGALQKLSIHQDRDLNVWEEIGTDGIIEIHPKGATKIELQVNRLVFDGLRITEAFGRGFINIHAQRIPFNIEIIEKNNEDAITTVFHNCWFRRYAPSYQSDNFLISEDATIFCEYVSTSSKGHSAVFGGFRGIKYDYDSIERTTDSTGRRGRFDSVKESGSQSLEDAIKDIF